MSNRKNPMPGIVAGLLGGALNYFAAKQKHAKEEETYQRRLKYQYDLDQQKSDRDMQDWSMKNRHKEDLTNEAYDAFDTATDYRTVPEVQVSTQLGNIEPNGTVPIVQKVLGLGRRTNPFETLSEEDYYKTLRKLSRNDSLAGTETAEEYQKMAERMKYKPAMPLPKYKTDTNEQTGQITYYDENNPFNKPVTINAPGIRKDSFQIDSSSTSPYILRINSTTGEVQKLGRNPGYRPQRAFSVQDGYGVSYNYETGRVSVTPIPELLNEEKEKLMRSNSTLKLLNEQFMKTMGDIQTYNVASRMGQKDIYDSGGKVYSEDDFVGMVKNQRGALAEDIKSFLGSNRGIFDSLYNLWQEDKITEYDFKTELWNKVSDMFDEGKLSATEADLYSKLYYLTWGMFPSEAKKEEYKLNAGN